LALQYQILLILATHYFLLCLNSHKFLLFIENTVFQDIEKLGTVFLKIDILFTFSDSTGSNKGSFWKCKSIRTRNMIGNRIIGNIGKNEIVVFISCKKMINHLRICCHKIICIYLFAEAFFEIGIRIISETLIHTSCSSNSICLSSRIISDDIPGKISILRNDKRNSFYNSGGVFVWILSRTLDTFPFVIKERYEFEIPWCDSSCIARIGSSKYTRNRSFLLGRNTLE